jgi:23S rRNA (guanosine2251-2'-O)-methyltransferase
MPSSDRDSRPPRSRPRGEGTRKKNAATRSKAGSRAAPEGDILVGRRPILELLKNDRPVERVFIAQGLAPSGVLGEIRKRSETAGIPVRMVPRAEVDRLAGGANHQGVAAVTGRFRYTPLEKLLVGASPALLFLDGLTDPHNLGSLLRSADSAGFNGVVVPSHRSVGVTGAVRRVSAGAAEIMPVARVKNLAQAVDDARKAGLWILGLDAKAEQDLWSCDLTEPPLGLVLGSEDRGMSRIVRERCDGLVRIPQSGRIGSLNVAVAGAIAMFEVARKRDLSANL